MIHVGKQAREERACEERANHLSCAAQIDLSDAQRTARKLIDHAWRGERQERRVSRNRHMEKGWREGSMTDLLQSDSKLRFLT